MAQGKAGLWIAGICAVVVFISVGYGLGRRAGANPAIPAAGSLSPAGAPPPPAVQIEPIQPSQEMAAISSSNSNTNGSVSPAASHTTSAESSEKSSAKSNGSAALPMEESARVREIQKALKAAGFDPGPVDGRMGGKTKTAVHDFQVANGLDADGKVGPKTWSKLESFLSQPSQPQKSND